MLIPELVSYILLLSQSQEKTSQNVGLVVFSQDAIVLNKTFREFTALDYILISPILAGYVWIWWKQNEGIVIVMIWEKLLFDMSFNFSENLKIQIL